MHINEIYDEASRLSEEERASLASRLLHGLTSPVYQVADSEVTDRVKEGNMSPERLISFEELVSRLKLSET